MPRNIASHPQDSPWLSLLKWDEYILWGGSYKRKDKEDFQFFL